MKWFSIDFFLNLAQFSTFRLVRCGFISNGIEPEEAILNMIFVIGLRYQSSNYETSKHWKKMLMQKPEILPMKLFYET
jgi:hypothetical protein